MAGPDPRQPPGDIRAGFPGTRPHPDDSAMFLPIARADWLQANPHLASQAPPRARLDLRSQRHLGRACFGARRREREKRDRRTRPRFPVTPKGNSDDDSAK